MFRSNSDGALVNRMGFNNPGAVAVNDRLTARRASGMWPKVPVAANIGRSRKTPNESAPSDYSSTLEMLWNHADMFVLNVSSPNTPGLRELQEVDHLSSILAECKMMSDRKGGGKPLLLKLSPDNNDEEIIASAQMAMRRGIDGFVATNTTLHRPVPRNATSRSVFAESGGLSGRPLQARSKEVIRLLYGEVGSSVPIVGVGGIDSADTAWQAVTSGASLLQLYSALVFNGPSVIRGIVKGLKKRVKENGFLGIEEAVGIDIP
jgi:dihydroorotate dehydrogenase